MAVQGPGLLDILQGPDPDVYCPFPHPLYPRKRVIPTASATAIHQANLPAESSSVHPQETSAPFPPLLTYRARLIDKCREEYYATANVYRLLDDRDGKLRVLDLEDCRSEAYFAIKKQERTVIVLARSCRLRWCPLCSKAKTARLTEAVSAWLKTEVNAKFLTLTLKHSSEPVAQQITRLYACFRELRRKKYLNENLKGGIWFFQIKWSQETRQWHPHLHCLIDSEYIPHAYLKRTWHNITGDSDVVDIRIVRNAKAAAAYVARYASRPANLAEIPSLERMELVDALHGRRILGKWGTGNAITLADDSESGPESYIRIAKFADVVCLATSSPLHQLLYACYRDNRPIPLCYDISKMEFAPHFTSSDSDLKPDPPPKHSYLFPTNAY